MTTPICDFVRRYAASGAARLHMPGHKGEGFLGFEHLDITETGGADSLYNPQGIIAESEENARALFGSAETLYSAEGSSQCIRAMLYLAVLAFGEKHPGARPAVIAPRNVHKAFLTACALLDFDVIWLFPEEEAFSLCRCDVTAGQLEDALEKTPNAAGVYITSPDYLGNCADIPAFAALAHKKGVPLLVDNAHGAYLRFLTPSRHPLTQGADLCCDSAHKTLPVLTGGAYLHIADAASGIFHIRARAAMAMFGSTSPSYLILQSLDRANQYMADGYAERLEETARKIAEMKDRLLQHGWQFVGGEPMKITLDAKQYGCTGTAAAAYLQARGIICEYADRDYTVFMVTPQTSDAALARLESALGGLERRRPLREGPPRLQRPEYAMSIRRAMLLPCESVRLADAAGRVAASLSVSCPPAISPVVPGERVSENAAAIYRYYGVETLGVAAE